MLNGLGKSVEAGFQIFAKMHSEYAASALGEDIEIAASLRGLYGAEGVFLAGHGKVGSIIGPALREGREVYAARAP